MGWVIRVAVGEELELQGGHARAEGGEGREGDGEDLGGAVRDLGAGCEGEEGGEGCGEEGSPDEFGEAVGESDALRGEGDEEVVRGKVGRVLPLVDLILQFFEEPVFFLLCLEYLEHGEKALRV